MKIRCVLFDIDDTLYDASFQMSTARLNAIKAMIESGLPTNIEIAYRVLEEIVKEFGPHHNRHYDKLLERLGLAWNPRVIAAGVIAYRETSPAYLKPYSDTIPVLLKLRQSGYQLGIVSEGRSVKQWQKLIQLGIQHLFHRVVISEDIKEDAVTPEMFKLVLKDLDVLPEETLFVGNQLDTDILCANRAGVVSVRMRKGEHRVEEPKSPEMTPKYEINKLSEIFEVLKAEE
ncbi:MAG: TIGR02253 family HAD-type hydrolase [Candidatus Bathyarchaeota archaeon]|nr:TIGR02253 family HAD-type hydrolase [Candidatus Bathyarchaeota archaeon]MDH5595592.1 TIGR02253 family HAD-type hydrolase [Candidatus Bathyarchaeota archaeon]